jgi:hypothetical protein
MKSTLEKLSKNEKAALAHLYGTDGFKALERFCELDTIGIGRDALVAQDMNRVSFLKGQVYMLEHIPALIRELHKAESLKS